MSEEAQDAAIGQTVRNYKTAKEKLAALEGELKRVSEAFSMVGANTSHIQAGIIFKFGKDQITVADESHSYGQTRTIAEIGLKYLNAESLIALLKDFQDTRSTVEALRANLKNTGLDLS